MRVLFLTKYPRRGPSSRYRVLQYIPYLEREGFVCEQHSLHAEGYLGTIYAGEKKPAHYHLGRLLDRTLMVLGARRYDAVFVQKELVPYAPPVLESILRLNRSKVIYDIDDAIFLFYEQSGNPIVRRMLGGKIPTVLRWSSAVLAGNRYLAGYAARYNAHARYFPTVVDTARYQEEMRGNLSLEAGETPVVVWIGSPETVHFLEAYDGVLRRARARAPFRLRAIGLSGYRGGALDVEAVPWREESEIAEIARCTIGIMPLPEDEWAKGKCGLKLLQYMACGLPVVTSPGGGAEEIVRHGRDGYIARSADDWVEQLELLLADPSLRRSMGASGRERVEEAYSISLWAPRMADLLKCVIRGEPVPGGQW